MKSKKHLLIAVVLTTLISANANATGGGKMPPPEKSMQKVSSPVSWYSYLLSQFSFL